MNGLCTVELLMVYGCLLYNTNMATAPLTNILRIWFLTEILLNFMALLTHINSVINYCTCSLINVDAEKNLKICLPFGYIYIYCEKFSVTVILIFFYH
jgi:hypothetical protein